MTVSDDNAGFDRDQPDGDQQNGDGERLAQLLTSLADDPAAPPSSVSAMSVIAAAKAAARAEEASRAEAVAAVDDRPIAPDQPADPGAKVPTADVIEFRPRRRRFALAGLVAAASLAGIAVLGISLTVSGGSSTSTSANGARAASAESAGSFDSPGAAELAQPPAADAAAAGSQLPDEVQTAGAAPATSAAAGASAAAGSGPAADSAAGCWPELNDRALAALTGALPTGAFSSPQPLTADCEPDPVGGALLPGNAQGRVLVVRVSSAPPGACVSDTSSGTVCAAKGDNVYVASDAAGAPVVYAYGNGNQVVVSGWFGAGDSVALPSGLTVEQSVAAAQAVLDALN